MVMSQNGARSSGGAAAQAADLGPLAWVLEETRRSIETASKKTISFARDAKASLGVDMSSVDASQLRLARQQLHQAVGALEMVGQPVASQMVRGMEAVIFSGIGPIQIRLRQLSATLTVPKFAAALITACSTSCAALI